MVDFQRDGYATRVVLSPIIGEVLLITLQIPRNPKAPDPEMRQLTNHETHSDQKQ
jgi:hypothetical protein